ncbi:MAG: putative nucleotidyltransferase substrate binding domain-containing protein [Thiohalophilus sp.]
MGDPAKTQLNTLPLLRDLPGEDRDALQRVGARHRLEGGAVLFREGDVYPGRLYLLIEGRIGIRRQDGLQFEVAPGELLGLSNYLDKSPYHSTATALTPVELLEIPDAALKQLESSHPAIADLISRTIAERIRTRSWRSQVEQGPLAQPVRSIMKSPLSTCHTGLSLREAFLIMQDRKIGSLGVLDDNDELFGVLTYAGLAEALALKGVTPGHPLDEAACDTPRTIDSTAPVWQAHDLLSSYNTKYLIVTEDARPVGLVSQTDLLRSLISADNSLLERIDQARTLDECRRHYDNLYQYASQCQQTNRYTSQAVRLLSHAHLHLQRRVVELTLAEMASEHGPPPCRYALLIMGSGGRQEMLLNPDQDNGLIIDDRDGPPDAGTLDWFEQFAEKLNPNLDQAGYILCPGDIMARNPMFRKTLSQWQQQFTHLVNKPNLKGAVWSNIVFDFDTLYGDDSLTYTLRRHLLNALQENTRLLDYMVEHDAEGKPAIGLFNRLVTSDTEQDRGSIDIKRNGLRIIADAARVYALANGITQRNTLDRLKALVHRGVLSADLVDAVSFAYEELLDMILQNQIQQKRTQQPLDKRIYPEQLTDQMRSLLRMSMRAIKRLQDRLQGQFGRAAF